MVQGTAAKVGLRSGFLLGMTCLLLSIPSLVVSDVFVSGLSAPTGLAIHPRERSLYVKSGSSGTVWKVPLLLPAPPANSVKVVTDQFQPPLDIKFDAAGNLYGTFTNPNQRISLWRLDPSKGVCSSGLFRAPQATGIAVETPGLSSSRLFFTETEEAQLYSMTPSSFECNEYGKAQSLGRSCGLFRFLLYRPSTADLVGGWGNTVSSVNISTGSCTPLVSDLAQPNGLAEDTDGNLYIADTGKGEIVRRTPQGQTKVIARGLVTPTGLVFDSTTGFLFVSETNAGRVTILPTVEQQTPYSEGQTLEMPPSPR